jgi:hypothetical protein
MTQNIQGAIEDFEVAVEGMINDEQKSRRRRWIDALRTGKDPFTDEEIKTLFDE